MMKSAYYDSPFGILQVGYEEDTLVLLKLCAEVHAKNEPSAFTDEVHRQVCEYFDGKRKTFHIPYAFHGTGFQEKVWSALKSIPYGSTMSYGELAKAIGSPKSARAVGGACNRNPIWLIVPCHRVVGADGSLTGYGGGIKMKEKLLRMEKSNAAGSGPEYVLP